MKREPLISVITSSNRPFFWKRAYNSIRSDIGDIEFEYIFVGPEEPDFSLPNNVKHIKTKNIKNTQCMEIGLRNATGKIFMLQADDVVFRDKGLFTLYNRYLERCEMLGHENVVVVPGLKDGRHTSTLQYGKTSNGPIASLNSAVASRKLFSKIGGIDIRFVACYYDCDLAMRLHENGANFEVYGKVWVIEVDSMKQPYRLHKVCKRHDRNILDSFWTRYLKEVEDPLPDDAYCYMRHKEWVVTKKRQKEVITFSDEDILTKSQGVKEYGILKWD